jgi:hypothetical protein
VVLHEHSASEMSISPARGHVLRGEQYNSILLKIADPRAGLSISRWLRFAKGAIFKRVQQITDKCQTAVALQSTWFETEHA